MQGSRFICRGYNHDRIIHRAVAFEQGDCAGDSSFLLADGYVNTNQVFALLIDNCIDRNRGFSCLAVANDQLALTASDRDHCVNGLNPCLNRCINILPSNHTRSNSLDRAVTTKLDRAFTIDWFAKRIHHTPNKSITNWHGCDSSSAAHDHTFANSGIFTHDNNANAGFLQVEGNANNAVRKLYQFLRLNTGQALHPRDSITRFDHSANIADT